MSFSKDILANMPSLKKRKVEYTESTRTNGSKKLKSRKIKKLSSSSESELNDDASKNKISPKKRIIRRKTLTKKHLNTTRTSSMPKSIFEDKNSRAEEGTEQLKENDSKILGTNHSSDSDEPPLVIDEALDNDLKELQNYMKENVKSMNSSPTKSKCNIPNIKSNSKKKSRKNFEKSENDDGVEIKIKLFENSKVDTLESDSDVPGTQETIKTVNLSKVVKTKIDVNKKLNVISSESESDHEEKKQPIGNIRKDEASQKIPIKNSKADTSESDSDIEETQKNVNAADCDKDVRIKIDASKKLNLVVSESESDSEEKQKTVNVRDFKTDTKPTKSVNKNSNAVSSESESDIEGSQITMNRRKNSNKDAKINASANEKSIIAAPKSEFDPKEKQGTTMSTQHINKDAKTLKDANKFSQASSSESESNEEDKHITINKSTCTKDENIKIDVEKQSNLNTVETEIGEEKVTEDFKNICNSPIINYDIEMLNELKEKKFSDSSDFEFSLGNGSSHEEKAQESSDAGTRRKSRSSNHIVKNRKKRKEVHRKKSPKSFRKDPSPPPEVKQEPREVSSDDSAEEEDLNEIGVSSNYARYKPTEEERTQLVNMLVKLRHFVPPQHLIESTAGTRTLNENERELFEEHITLKHGKFSPQEDKQIKKNWKTFCEDNDWDPKKPQPFLFMKHKNKVFLLNQHSRRKFMRGLAHGLPDRCLYSVFQRFKILFEPHRTCRYESDEDRKILDYVAVCEKKKTENKDKDVIEKDRKFAELAMMLRRTRASVWRRYRVLRKKADKESKDDFCHSSK